MKKKIEIAQVNRIDADRMVVAFSDGTSEEYTAEELHALHVEDEADTGDRTGI